MYLHSPGVAECGGQLLTPINHNIKTTEGWSCWHWSHYSVMFCSVILDPGNHMDVIWPIKTCLNIASDKVKSIMATASCPSPTPNWPSLSVVLLLWLIGAVHQWRQKISPVSQHYFECSEYWTKLQIKLETLLPGGCMAYFVINLALKD